MPQFTQAVTIPTGRPDEQTSETESNYTKSRRNRSAARCVGDKRKGWLGFQGQNTWLIYFSRLFVSFFFPQCAMFIHISEHLYLNVARKNLNWESFSYESTSNLLK